MSAALVGDAIGRSLRITVLVENSVNRAGLKAEHGLSWLLELGSSRVLFDTGQTDLLLDNAKALGASVESLDAIVLSHGHYDHTGGLVSARRRAPGARVFIHPDATVAKFTEDPDGSPRFIGMSEAGRQSLREATDQVVFTTEPREVMAGVMVTGPIPRDTSFEDVGGRFFLDAAFDHPDPLMDDQALYCPTREGTVVVLGCAHAGVINTLRHIRRLTGGARFRAVLGGLHLLHASHERLEATVAALREWDVPMLVPCHCTGLAPIARLWECFPGRCAGLSVGSRFAFEV